MILVFRGIGNYCQMEIDRDKKLLKFVGESTNYQPQNLPWKMLADRLPEDQQIKQLEVLNKLDDKEFVNVLKTQMAIYGWKLTKWEH